MRFAVDVTACWRPRVGMVTVATELTRALVTQGNGDSYTLLCSRERPESLRDLKCDALLAPYRHELALKLRWLPAVEASLDSDAILYPYWPSPPRRSSSAPPAAVFVYDLAFKLRPAEVPWQQRLYFGTILEPALRQAAAVLTISERTRIDLLDWYHVPGLDEKTLVVPLGVSASAPAGPLPDGITPGFILAVGTVEPRKNYPRLLAAYRRLRGGVLALPLVEAMAHGLPSVVSTAGALPELAGDAAVLVDPEDVTAIEVGLEKALTDRTLRERLSAAGRERAQHFTWQRTAVLTRDALRRIA